MKSIGGQVDLIRGFTDVVGLAVPNARLYQAWGYEERLEKANERLRVDKLKDELFP